MRALGILIAFTIVCSFAPAAHAGDCPDCGPPALDDSGKQPSVKQAMDLAKKLLKAIERNENDKLIAAVSIPLLVDESGHALADQSCGGGWVTEAEGMPGTPQCLIATLGPVAKKLHTKATKRNVFASLAKLEAKKGALRSPSRPQLEALKHHRFVFMKAGDWTLVVAVRIVNKAPAVDAVIVEPPPGWTAEPEVTTPPEDLPADLDKDAVKAGVDAVTAKIEACGDKFPAVTGTVKLKVTVDAKGKPTLVSVLDSPDAALGRCAADGMRTAKFAQTQNGGSFVYPFAF